MTNEWTRFSRSWFRENQQKANFGRFLLPPNLAATDIIWQVQRIRRLETQSRHGKRKHSTNMKQCNAMIPLNCFYRNDIGQFSAGRNQAAEPQLAGKIQIICDTCTTYNTCNTTKSACNGNTYNTCNTCRFFHV